MKIKKLWNFNLYIEGLKQLSKIGIVELFILAIFGCFSIPLTNDFEAFLSVMLIFSMSSCFTFTPIMAFNLLGFVNNRKIGDFYYTIPYSRVCIGFSYTTAIFTYSLGAAVLFLPATLLSDTYDGNALLSFICLVVVYIFIISVITLSSALTCTTFSNFVLTGIIIFLPRILSAYICEYVYDFCSFLDDEHISPLLSGEYNLFSFDFFDYMLGDDYSYGISIIYTLTISIIYLILAGIAFNKKKSDYAGYETGSKIVQTIIRCTVTLVACLLPLSGILELTYYSSDENGLTVFGILLFYLAAVFVYFLYEIISTKSVRTLKKIAPGLLIVLVMNIIVFAITLGFCSYARSFKPEPEDIDYIQIQTPKDDSFYSKIYPEIKLTDDKTKEYVSDLLQLSIKHSKDDCYSDDYYYYSYKGELLQRNLTVLICSNGKKYYRNIEISNSIRDEIFDNIITYEDFIKKASNLPATSESTEFYALGKDAKQKELEAIYNVYREELKALSRDKQEAIIAESIAMYEYHENSSLSEFKGEYLFAKAFFVDFNGYNGYDVLINITPDTPKAYELYIKLSEYPY